MMLFWSYSKFTDCFEDDKMDTMVKNFLFYLMPGIEPCECLNGGFCPNPQNPRVCECREGFYGTLCESGK